jgi:hypothetical protein
MLQEDEEDNEAGEQLFNQLYCTTNQELVDAYKKNPGIVHLQAEPGLSAIQAITQCILECTPIMDVLLANDSDSKDCQVMQFLRRIALFASENKE